MLSSPGLLICHGMFTGTNTDSGIPPSPWLPTRAIGTESPQGQTGPEGRSHILPSLLTP